MKEDFGRSARPRPNRSSTSGEGLCVAIPSSPCERKRREAPDDGATRLDRVEPDLNEATPGDRRDTTTPAAMADNLAKLVVGDALSAQSRDRLSAWMVANTTGDKRLRAGAPKGWRVGGKTGSGGHAETNDVAVFWPPDRGPIAIAAYYAASAEPDDARNGVLAEVGRLAAMV